jgi:hypothetical protein
MNVEICRTCYAEQGTPFDGANWRVRDDKRHWRWWCWKIGLLTAFYEEQGIDDVMTCYVSKPKRMVECLYYLKHKISEKNS